MSDDKWNISGGWNLITITYLIPSLPCPALPCPAPSFLGLAYLCPRAEMPPEVSEWPNDNGGLCEHNTTQTRADKTEQDHSPQMVLEWSQWTQREWGPHKSGRIKEAVLPNSIWPELSRLQGEGEMWGLCCMGVAFWVMVQIIVCCVSLLFWY